MKDIIIEQFKDKYCTIDDIYKYMVKKCGNVSRNTVIWNVNDIVKQGQAIRVGRGVYGFISKPIFQPKISKRAEDTCSLLRKSFKYLDCTVTDTSFLNQFMNLQPFVAIITLEIKKSAVNPILSELRKSGIDAYAKKDFSQIERYVSSSQPVLVRQELAVNPSLSRKSKVRISNLEKTLVDLICDKDIYSQYREELWNIYRNAVENYAINFSQMLKYAAARNKRVEVEEQLEGIKEFSEVRALL